MRATLVFLIVAAMAFAAPRQSPDTSFHADWHNYERLAKHIHDLPDWPTQGDFERHEWNAYLRTARALQLMAPAEVDCVYVVYATSASIWAVQQNERRRVSRPDVVARWPAKLTILTRLMYDVKGVGNEVVPADSLPFRLRDQALDRNDPAIPVAWSDDGPKLSANSSYAGGGFSLTRDPYQPQASLRVIRSQCAPRVLDVPEITSWRDLFEGE